MNRGFWGGWVALGLTTALAVLVLGSGVAQAAGCPVLATNAFAIPEVSGGAAELVDDQADRHR